MMNLNGNHNNEVKRVPVIFDSVKICGFRLEHNRVSCSINGYACLFIFEYYVCNLNRKRSRKCISRTIKKYFDLSTHDKFGNVSRHVLNVLCARLSKEPEFQQNYKCATGFDIMNFRRF